MKLDRHTRRSGEVETGKGRLAEKKGKVKDIRSGEFIERKSRVRADVMERVRRDIRTGTLMSGVFKEKQVPCKREGDDISARAFASEVPRIKGKRGSGSEGGLD